MGLRMLGYDSIRYNGFTIIDKQRVIAFKKQNKRMIGKLYAF